jgi:cytochrome b561
MLTRYRPAQIRLHWIVAILIAYQLIVEAPLGRALRQARNGLVPEFNLLVSAHVYVGITILLLVLWRLVLRLRHGAPPPPQTEPAKLQHAAKLAHWTLYAIMIALPISGLTAWYGGIELAAEVHEAMKPVLIGLLALHIAAVLWHQFWLKDGLMSRMSLRQKP